jgi:light-regulated signal transduction histidine kinase (bacteriophytochrome)
VLQRRQPGNFSENVVSLCKALPTSRPSRLRTLAYLKRSLTRAASSKSPASTNRSSSPTPGLGLAIAKKIIEMQGGRISVGSMAGKGAAFRVELPQRARFSKSTA